MKFSKHSPAACASFLVWSDFSVVLKYDTWFFVFYFLNKCFNEFPIALTEENHQSVTKINLRSLRASTYICLNRETNRSRNVLMAYWCPNIQKIHA